MLMQPRNPQLLSVARAAHACLDPLQCMQSTVEERCEARCLSHADGGGGAGHVHHPGGPRQRGGQFWRAADRAEGRGLPRQRRQLIVRLVRMF